MGGENVNYNLSISNYCTPYCGDASECGIKSNETLMLFHANYKPAKSLTLSGGVGADLNFEKNTKADFYDSNCKLALEGKAKWQPNSYFNTQLRVRDFNITEKQQVRLTATGKYPINIGNKREITPYAALHGTYTRSNGNDKLNSGCWIGGTYKAANGCEISLEYQTNFGQKSNNQMINAIFSVPIDFK